MKKLAALISAGLFFTGVFAAEKQSNTAGYTPVKVNFARPSGWGGRVKFVDGEGQKYLQFVGDLEQKNNQFYYAFSYMPKVQGGETIAFKFSCKLENLTAGKFQIGIYEFADPKATKSICFQAVDVTVSQDWKTLSKIITLHPKTQAARFYFSDAAQGKATHC